MNAKLLDANQGSWLIMQHWGVSVGETIPDPWRTTAIAAGQSSETLERQLTTGMINISLLFLPVADQALIYIFGMDVTVQKQIEQKVELNAKVFESATEGILIMDAEMRVIDVNPAYSRITGFSPGEILGETAAFINTEEQAPELLRQLNEALAREDAWQGELWGTRKDGSRFAESLSISVIKNAEEETTHFTAVITDITLQKEAEKQLVHMAHFDMLTGLPNRRLFHDRLQQAILSANRSGECIAVMLIDLDGFKLVNDHLGHIAGDEMLQLMAHRIASVMRVSDTVARMGGDEFLVLLRHLNKIDSAEVIAEHILKTISAPVFFHDQEIFLTASIGISAYSNDQDSDTLLRLLDSVLYEAKQDGKNGYKLVSSATTEMATGRLTFQAKLRRALEDGEIKAYYQGILDTNTNTLNGLEVLARWESPVEGIISPEIFIPVAEESGMIRQLGEYILRTACRQGAQWLAQGIDTGIMSVNVSAYQLHDRSFVSLVKKILSETGFPAERLDLELSEALWVEGRETVTDALRRLRAMGIRVSIDDFGTKYASLSYLKHLPVDRIKIDKSFVDDIPDSDITCAIVASIMNLARAIKLEVVAEGIENEEQLKFLIDNGCRYIQGYLYYKPLPAEGIEEKIKNRAFSLESTTGSTSL
ncbi:putative bifunctional diguanylate cyclase/phosphodiesterase [Saccharospirillum sp.]|uniref:putative bifunctional diguanylate cyclase/phosphodiesterase n=1 Tax=Saccharospirillum sp. TaxID=2033801 RepID=UPI0034A01332